MTRPESNSDSSPSEKMDKITPSQRPFTRTNYYMMFGCLMMIIVGFLLMSGGGADTETGFNPEIFSTRRIVVGPAIAFLGFLLMAFAIVWHPSKPSSQTNTDDAQRENNL